MCLDLGLWPLKGSGKAGPRANPRAQSLPASLNIHPAWSDKGLPSPATVFLPPQGLHSDAGPPGIQAHEKGAAFTGHLMPGCSKSHPVRPRACKEGPATLKTRISPWATLTPAWLRKQAQRSGPGRHRELEKSGLSPLAQLPCPKPPRVAQPTTHSVSLTEIDTVCPRLDTWTEKTDSRRKFQSAEGSRSHSPTTCSPTPGGYGRGLWRGASALRGETGSWFPA